MSQPPLVTLPLESLHREGTRLYARRTRYVGKSDIKELMRPGDIPFVIANVGDPLRWIEGNDQFRMWIDELHPRLVAADAKKWSLDDYPDGRCYVASEWRHENAAVCVLFELYH